MYKTKSLLLILMATLAMGATAQVKTFSKAPRLFNVKAAAQGTPTTMRDSIVSREADGSLRSKTTYTYDEHGYLTSKLCRYSDGTYDAHDSYYVDYAFDAQGRCTLRSKSECTSNGRRGEETERTEAFYDHEGYYYYEIRYEWNEGQRYAAEEIGYDEWMNPVYGIGREYDGNRLDVTYVARQQFTGRAYAQKEGSLELVMHHRLVSSVLYDKEPDEEKYVVWGERREMTTQDDRAVTTYYKLYAGDVSLDGDLTSSWTEDHQLVWQLNAAHTRPLSMRYRSKDYAGAEWADRPHLSVKFTWDDKDCLIGVSDYDGSWSNSYTYADDQAKDVPLQKLLDVEDSDSWEDGGIEGYEGDLLYNWFGRLATYKFRSKWEGESLDVTIDQWDEAGRFTHAIQSAAEGDDEVWGKYRADGKVSEIIWAGDEEDQYDKEVWVYDRWGIVSRIVFYVADSFDGPWVKSDNRDDSYDSRRHRIRKAYDRNAYQEGNWLVFKEVETDDNGNILYGTITKEWMGRRYRYTLDTYEDLRGPLQYDGYDEESVEESVDESPFNVIIDYRWDPDEQRWVTDFHGYSGYAYAHTVLSDGRIQNERYRWDEASSDFVLDAVTETLTLDEQQRVVVREVDGQTDRFTWYADTHWLQQSQWADGQTDTYYYSGHEYVDPELLSIDERHAETPSDTWYNLQGQRIADKRPATPGIYIHAGRKTVVR